jgi:hypothetical protein
MSARLFAVSGSLSQLRAGEMFSPSQVYFGGIGWPSAKLGLVTFIAIVLPLSSSNPVLSDPEQLAIIKPSNSAVEKNESWVNRFIIRWPLASLVPHGSPERR